MPLVPILPENDGEWDLNDGSSVPFGFKATRISYGKKKALHRRIREVVSETAEMWQVVHHLYGLTNDPPHMDQNLRTKRPIQGHMQPDDVPIV